MVNLYIINNKNSFRIRIYICTIQVHNTLFAENFVRVDFIFLNIHTYDKWLFKGKSPFALEFVFQGRPTK